MTEYLLAVSPVAVGWSGYGIGLLHSLRIHVPAVLVVAAIASLLNSGTRQSTMFATVVGLCLLAQMNLANWMLLAGWMAVGRLIFVGYGYRHIALRRHG